MSLKKYTKKRNFTRTPEPKGKRKPKKSATLLYIIQKHDASHLHYDFRLELNGVLLSWAVPKGPCLDPNIKRLAMHVEDHPLDYGSFEGIIPKGEYGGGTVMLWDKGTWISQDENPVKAYHQGSMKFYLKGKKLNGLWKLVRMHKDDKTWLLIKGQDEFSKSIKDYDVIITEPNSVKTARKMQDIAEQKNIHFKLKPENQPTEFLPQLATLVEKPPTGKNWLHEIKFDGYRMIAIKKNGKTKLMSRTNKDWSKKFKNVVKAINALSIKNIMFDGEIVVFDTNKKTDFQSLQNAIKEQNQTFYYYIFDLPYYDQYNLCSLPLLKRKEILLSVIGKNNETLLYSDHIIGSGKKVLDNACKLTLEGIVSKEINSEYESVRSKTWLKSKCIKRQEFVIGGYTKPQGNRMNFGSLLIGTFNENRELIYNGHVGTGFTSASLNSLHTLLKKHIIQENPFISKPPKINKVSWVKPIFVAEIEFTEWTQDGLLRHPSFKGLRMDKKSSKVIKEKPHTIISHADKIFYPEDKITKQDIANYYEQIQKWILPYIINRPLTLLRCPDGYKKCFYQKHVTDTTPKTLFSEKIKEKSATANCIYIKDLEGLMSLVQLGVLEIHPWGSCIDDIEYPDMITFDLDPAPDVKWIEVVETAKLIRKELAKIKLKSFVKTTGGKGLHVVVPIKPEYKWTVIKHFAKTFVDFIVQKNPQKYISESAKAKRKNKIFLDYLRNQRGATAIAAYSTRARVHAPVSVPLAWSELTDEFADTFFTVKTLPTRFAKLKTDPWQNFFKVKQKLIV